MPKTQSQRDQPELRFGSFRKLGVPYVGVLIIRILLFRYYIRVPGFRKPPFSVFASGATSASLFGSGRRVESRMFAVEEGYDVRFEVP